MEVQSPRPLNTAPLPSEPRFASHLEDFEERFGKSRAGGLGARLFFAPGRVNLMGAHLDYNGGPVMPMAIDRGTFLVLRPRRDGMVRIATSMDSDSTEFALGDLLAKPDPKAEERWWDYSVGVLLALAKHALLRGDSGSTPTSPAACAILDLGFDLYYGGDLPVGAGLSSSASISLVTAVALNAHLGLDLSVDEAIEAALFAEREFVGVQCGIMDPFAVGYAKPGHLLLLECKDQSWQHVELDPHKYTVGIIDTMVRRELAKGEFNLRVEQCAAAFTHLSPFAPGAMHLSEIPLSILDAHEAGLEAAVAKRARHVIEETARTYEARDALKMGDVPAFGCAMFDAHDSLREFFEVSIDELNTIVEFAKSHEAVLGGRLTGAGFGGCVAVILRAGSELAFESSVVEAYERAHKSKPRVAFYRGSPGLGEVALG